MEKIELFYQIYLLLRYSTLNKLCIEYDLSLQIS